jgi:hypothetical protein
MTKDIVEAIGGSIVAIFGIIFLMVLFQGWPSFVTHNHYHYKSEEDYEDEGEE